MAAGCGAGMGERRALVTAPCSTRTPKWTCRGRFQRWIWGCPDGATSPDKLISGTNSVSPLRIPGGECLARHIKLNLRGNRVEHFLMHHDNGPRPQQLSPVASTELKVPVRSQGSREASHFAAHPKQPHGQNSAPVSPARIQCGSCLSNDNPTILPYQALELPPLFSVSPQVSPH